MRRRVDEVEEQLETSRKSLTTAESEKKNAEDQLQTTKAELTEAQATLKDKEEKVAHWESEYKKMDKYADSLMKENTAKDKEWNDRWAEYSQRHDQQIESWRDNFHVESKKAKKATKKLEQIEEECKDTKDALVKTKARWAEAAEAQRKAMEEGARLMKELREVSAAKVEELAAVQENLTKKEAEFDVLRKDKEVLEKDAETAAAKAKELEEKATKLEGDKGQLEEQTKAYVLIIIGLVGLITLFLLFQCLRACCCGGSKTVAAERGNIVRYENMLRLLILDYLTAEISPLFHNMKRSLQIPTLSLNQKILRPRKRRRRQRNRKRKKRKMSERLDASTNIT